jgi:hypothetical protein
VNDGLQGIRINVFIIIVIGKGKRKSRAGVAQRVPGFDRGFF